MGGILTTTGYVGFLKQAAKGTGIQSTKFAHLSGPEGIVQNQDFNEYRTMSKGQELDVIKKTLHRPNGTFQDFLRPSNGAYLLAMALGADAITGESAPYTHTLTRADVIPWLSFERYLTACERISDCKINQIVLRGEAGQPVLIDVNFIGIDSAIVAAATASYETNDMFMFFDGTFTLDGGAITNISSFEITLNRNLEVIQTVDYIADDILERGFSIDVNFTL